jgi:hypothetical protein
MEEFITEDYLRKHPNEIFVYGDNTEHYGLGGAAKLRYSVNTYGFITKKYPDNKDSSFYTLPEYQKVYDNEITKLRKIISENTEITFLISKLGAGLANRYKIFELVIEPNIRKDLNYPNVRFLW